MKPRSENHFFMGTALWFLVIVFWGFAPSFYLLKLDDDSEPLPTHLVFHGIVFTIWVLLYAVQVTLIRVKNYKLHKALGIFGLVVMIVMVPAGIFPSIYKFFDGRIPIDAAGHNVFRLSIAYLFFTLALIYRRKPLYHKRFMLGCMVMLMGAAIFRISMDFELTDNQVFNKGLQIFPAIMLLIFDLVKYKRLVLIDLLSIVAVMGIYFLADYFWLSSVGGAFMDFLIFMFISPFV